MAFQDNENVQTLNPQFNCDFTPLHSICFMSYSTLLFYVKSNIKVIEVMSFFYNVLLKGVLKCSIKSAWTPLGVAVCNA